MSDVAIRVEHLSKQYRIGKKQERYYTLRDTIADAFTAPLRWVRSRRNGGSPNGGEEDTIWALKDVSFEVKHGEVVGIIGRNGAGKSTLLKIFSRITEPTEGRVEIHGRVASLLEVGTGFHPELTGRENIYLNGAILGMSKAEIDRKFDEIVEFAEIEKFIDTPVKRYSSGMYVRLAFAVAAHLEPEILLVDEVLAVGDAAFQKKCLGKMGDVAKAGRTVLFVSHNMDAVLTLCSQGIVLDAGHVRRRGAIADCVATYKLSVLQSSWEQSGYRWKVADDGLLPCITCVELLNSYGEPLHLVSTWDDVVFRIHYRSDRRISNGSFILEIRDLQDRRLMVFDSGLKEPVNEGHCSVDCCVEGLPLPSGEYVLGVGIGLSRSEWLWRNENIGVFSVSSRDVFGLGRPPDQSRMLFAVPHRWSNHKRSSVSGESGL